MVPPAVPPAGIEPAHMAQRTPKQYLRPIISDLEFFETGILKRNLGIKGFE